MYSIIRKPLRSGKQAVFQLYKRDQLIAEFETFDKARRYRSDLYLADALIEYRPDMTGVETR